MALKVSAVLLVSIEFILFAYILLDVYTIAFFGLNRMDVFPEDRIVQLNATNEDPTVVGIGNFAVDEYNKMSGRNLKLQSVVEAMSAESKYMLLIQVVDASSFESKHYATIVEKRGRTMRLLAFDEFQM
ncbi:hypothetical protein Salat_0278200 [Sesamum alatum]|uniref:Cystatin domain-containing protein n=1 Tax=Sesamum alatum TaxID=300844 RepID=A0AAE1Z0S4_9LAMI|nr:hypothetical protein Salat_0278200 [Sesamum alatum]